MLINSITTLKFMKELLQNTKINSVHLLEKKYSDFIKNSKILSNYIEQINQGLNLKILFSD